MSNRTTFVPAQGTFMTELVNRPQSCAGSVYGFPDEFTERLVDPFEYTPASLPVRIPDARIPLGDMKVERGIMTPPVSAKTPLTKLKFVQTVLKNLCME